MDVVFDLGGVVVAWNPDAIVANAVSDETLRPIARREIIDHPDWLSLDRGALSVDDVIRRATERSGLAESVVRALVESVPPSLIANPDTVALMRRVKEAGNRLFVLSNMPHDSMNHLERTYDFWDLFTGAVVSARVGHVKPEPAIFEHLLTTYDLDPARTVFIDDVQANVDAAATFGIRTIRFLSVPQCEAALREMRVL